MPGPWEVSPPSTRDLYDLCDLCDLHAGGHKGSRNAEYRRENGGRPRVFASKWGRRRQGVRICSPVLPDLRRPRLPPMSASIPSDERLCSLLEAIRVMFVLRVH